MIESGVFVTVLLTVVTIAIILISSPGSTSDGVITVTIDQCRHLAQFTTLERFLCQSLFWRHHLSLEQHYVREGHLHVDWHENSDLDTRGADGGHKFLTELPLPPEHFRLSHRWLVAAAESSPLLPMSVPSTSSSSQCWLQ